MRQIKFRGLRTDGKGWVYGDLKKVSDYRRGGSWYYIYVDGKDIDEEGEEIQIEPYSLGQFTGLHDNNGAEIYEGDLVKFSTRRYHLGRDKGLQTITFKSDVIFDDGCFMISETQKYDTYLYTHSSECQVIGNIHTQDGGQTG